MMKRGQAAALVSLALIFAAPSARAADTGANPDRPGAAAETPSYGGPLTLVDHTGRTVTDKTYRGRYMLIYFGYTFCPDVCPTELQIITQALEQMGAAAKRVQPLFITVDPKRDTAKALADYVSNFHPSLVGLTGTERQIHEAASAYHAHYAIIKYQGEILVDHTSSTYLVGTDGRFLTEFSHGTNAKAMSAAILRYMNRDKEKP